MSEDARTKNLARWEGLATLHAAGVPGYYDIEALVAGRNPIHPEVESELAVATGAAGVTGLDVLHVQSHIGVDAIELTRRGARVTCTDFSPTALEAAQRIAAAAGIELETVEADSTALPSSLHGRFDLAYATVGVISWIEDIDAWMRSVSACLRPGGTLLLVDSHALRNMADTIDPLVFDMSYTFTPGGLSFDLDGSYADPTAKLPATGGTCFAHSIGEIVTAAADAGLRVAHLAEITALSFDPNGEIPPDADGMIRWRIQGSDPLPQMFGLVARKN